MCLSQDVNRGAIQMQLVENFVQYFCLDLEIKLVGSCGTFSLNAPISISQDGHPCVFVGQKVLNRAAQIKETERLHKKLDWGAVAAFKASQSYGAH